MFFIDAAVFEFHSSDYENEPNEFPTSSCGKVSQFIRFFRHVSLDYRQHEARLQQVTWQFVVFTRGGVGGRVGESLSFCLKTLRGPLGDRKEFCRAKRVPYEVF